MCVAVNIPPSNESKHQGAILGAGGCQWVEFHKTVIKMTFTHTTCYFCIGGNENGSLNTKNFNPNQIWATCHSLIFEEKLVLKVGNVQKAKSDECRFVPNWQFLRFSIHTLLLPAHSLRLSHRPGSAFSTIDRILHSTDGSAERFATLCRPGEESLLSAETLDTSFVISKQKN